MIPIVNYLVWARHSKEATSNLDSFIKSISPDLIVRNGPFKGMKYPGIKSVGSTIIPKLLGSYENEISELVEQLCRNKYTEIIDIGCAEGYYAVGFAIRVPEATVYAFDTDDEAIRLCKQMAMINGVSNRIKYGSFCDVEILCSLKITESALIICDCEGYEKKLFSEDVVSRLAQYELLIEIHDFIDIETSTSISKAFCRTHDKYIFHSVDDIKKAQCYQFAELINYSLDIRKSLLAEGRPSVMEWFYFKPRQLL
jgi:hypothetical protein